MNKWYWRWLYDAMCICCGIYFVKIILIQDRRWGESFIPNGVDVAAFLTAFIIVRLFDHFVLYRQKEKK